MTTEEKFQAAVNIIRSLPKDGPYQPSHDMMLKFYGLYKQAVEGPCTEPKPAFYEVVKGYKWRAWSNLGSMTQAQAKNSYVEELKKIIETMAYTENVANFIDALGPFYEFIDMPGKKKINNNTKGLPEDEDLSDSEGNDNSMPVANGNVTHQENGFESVSSESTSHLSSPQLLSASETTDPMLSLAQELKDVDNEETLSGEEEEDEVVMVEVTSHESGVTTHQVSVAPHVYSDSDSDEEYSEPAESPDHLAQVDCGEAEVPLSSSHTLHLPHSQTNTRVSPPDKAHNLTHGEKTGQVEAGDVVTCGGGDQSHPGGLQMTPRQRDQASRFSAGRAGARSGSVFSLSHRDAQSSGGSGGAGGSSGDGSGGADGDGGGERVKEDVNAQLVVVLRRLQTDMESVLHRLNTLETLTVTQHHSVCHHCQGMVGTRQPCAPECWLDYRESGREKRGAGVAAISNLGQVTYDPGAPREVRRNYTSERSQNPCTAEDMAETRRPCAPEGWADYRRSGREERGAGVATTSNLGQVTYDPGAPREVGHSYTSGRGESRTGVATDTTSSRLTQVEPEENRITRDGQGVAGSVAHQPRGTGLTSEG